jgi:hypothetical protein
LDFQVALLSVPGRITTCIEAIPANVPYLAADSALIEHWRERLKSVEGFRVGINWHGREDDRVSARRDVPLDAFLALANIPGVRLVNLQKGKGREELLAMKERPEIFDPGDDWDQSRGAFMDTAAIMMNLDLVISSDTAVPHLAGALGVPVWTLLPFPADWRWLLDRSDSPWYPTMRLFRQKTRGDWSDVFVEARDALATIVPAKNVRQP